MTDLVFVLRCVKVRPGHLAVGGGRRGSNHVKCGRPNYLLSEEEPLDISYFSSAPLRTPLPASSAPADRKKICFHWQSARETFFA
ncbi:hypothetical protein NPIL_548051 [Nephila pilipes]|uniref:Uncharacterized protein n=1 Tax=Nephila pilipes TaxID=299642 RepID=A0A8X6PW47_NEPPI|nr:hypothetical protein NPIL_548051 [Nephila pilipes]